MEHSDFESTKTQLCLQMARLLPTLRKSLKLSQTELGEFVNISRQTISAAERGEYPLSWNQFASLYLVFGINQASHALLESNDLAMQNVAPVLVVPTAPAKQDPPYSQQ